MTTTHRILVILATPYKDSTKRDGICITACKKFAETSKKNGLKVDFLDLYETKTDWNIPSENVAKDPEILHMQMRIRHADTIVVFHPMIWSFVPSIVKAFNDKVLTSGFAYNYQKGVFYGLLPEKNLIVFATSELPIWQEKFIYNNLAYTYWKRIIADRTGMNCSIEMLGSIRSLSDKKVERWVLKVQNIADSLSNKQFNIVDMI